MPQSLADRCHLYMTHAIGCSASFTQIAGIAALAGPQDDIEMMRAEYEKRRNFVVEKLNAMPMVSCASPEGAFYGARPAPRLELRAGGPNSPNFSLVDLPKFAEHLQSSRTSPRCARRPG